MGKNIFQIFIKEILQMLHQSLSNKSKTKLLIKLILSNLLLCIIAPGLVQGQIDNYYINTSKKKIERKYYFKIMDSLVTASPNGSLYGCINCVKFMRNETKIPSSGKVTYFGQLDFTKEDLRRWHEWYEKKKNKEKQSGIYDTTY